jgi:hypothetical protein
VADNSDGSIWHLQQLIDGEWMITLEWSEMATVMIGGEP